MKENWKQWKKNPFSRYNRNLFLQKSQDNKRRRKEEANEEKKKRRIIEEDQKYLESLEYKEEIVEK